MNELSTKTLKINNHKSKVAFLTYGFTALIALLFIAVVATFEGVAYQLLVFILGLTFLAVALYRNIASETPSKNLPHERIQEKVESFFPHVSVSKVKHWVDQNGDSSILIQLEGRDIENNHIKSKVIRKFIKNQFKAEYVVVELL